MSNEPGLTSLSPPIVHPTRGDLPVLMSVPHSGRDYPDWLVALAARGRAALRPLEDPLVDRLVWRALGRGVGAVIATAPRAAIDCNRAEDDLDPAVIQGGGAKGVSARARSGLGVVPSRTHSHGYLWRRSIGGPQLEQRLADAHRPYHGAIQAQLNALVARFGCALLLDCHSMPPPPAGVAPVVFGDRHGRTAAGWLTDEAVRIARNAGFRAQLNDPFAGGHVIERHARPGFGVHALQVEIDRSCYLDASFADAGPGFDRVARLFESLVVGLGEALLRDPVATAAE